jgi:hypothetical protein
MPWRDLTIANRIALLDQIKSQLPSNSHCQLAVRVLKSTITCVIQQQDELQEEQALCKQQQRTQ